MNNEKKKPHVHSAALQMTHFIIFIIDIKRAKQTTLSIS